MSDDVIGGGGPLACIRCGSSHYTNPPEDGVCNCHYCGQPGKKHSSCNCLGSQFIPLLAGTKKDTSSTETQIKKLRKQLESDQKHNDQLRKIINCFSTEMLIFLECFLDNHWDAFQKVITQDIQNIENEAHEQKKQAYIASLQEKYGEHFENRLKEFESLKIKYKEVKEKEDRESEQRKKEEAQLSEFQRAFLQKPDNDSYDISQEILNHEFNFEEQIKENPFEHMIDASDTYTVYKHAVQQRLMSLFQTQK